jgi:MOSC domain-containing protein YiiM
MIKGVELLPPHSHPEKSARTWTSRKGAGQLGIAPELALLVAHRRPGFYFRVLQEGEVGAGDDIVKIADGPERITVAEVDALLYLPGHSREQLERALQDSCA